MVKRALRSLLQGEDSHQEEEKEIACLPKEQSIRVVVDGKFNWLTKDPVRLGYRYEKEFDAVQDVFELQVSTQSQWPALAAKCAGCWMDGWWMAYTWNQRNLNNAFAYDLVPSPSVITAALRAARRVNDYPTAVRIFEGRTPLEEHACFVHRTDLLLPIPNSYTERKLRKRLEVTQQIPAKISLTRNQSQSRKPRPIRRIPRRSQTPPRRTRRQPQGRPVPRTSLITTPTLEGRQGREREKEISFHIQGTDCGRGLKGWRSVRYLEHTRRS